MNNLGWPVEEFEIQFIDGEAIDTALAKAWGLNQADIESFLEAVEEWDDERKCRYIIAVGDCGYGHLEVMDDPDSIVPDLYTAGSLRELAEQFVEEGVFGDIPERLQFYIDYDAIARDLAIDYAEITIAGEQLVYRCG